MKKLVTVLFFYVLLFSTSIAIDNSSYYGDGVSVTFNDIRNTLPSLYRNTPVICVNTSTGAKAYFFNVEMYIDKGYLVYGEPSSVTDLGYTNSFKQTDKGYFYSMGVSGTRGEYRYLGLSINGTVYTNVSFPEDTVPGEHTYRVVKYSSLPDYLKERYGIPKEGNAYFESIRQLIDSPDSPAWNFRHTYSNGSSVTVYKKFEESNMVGNGVYPSLFEYARITGWGSGGGSLVLYYRSVNDSSVYRYATFTGSITPRWEKVFHGLDCYIYDHEPQYKMGKEEDSLTFTYKVRGDFKDNYSELSTVMKKYTYTRDDIVSYSLYSDGVFRNVKNMVYNNTNVVFSSSNILVQLNRENLTVGYNTVKLRAEAKVNLNGYIYTTSTEKDIIVFVEPKSTPSPTPTNTPEPTPTSTPFDTPFPAVKRRW